MKLTKPKDWRAKKLGKIFVFSGGYQATRKDLGTTGIPYLHYGDIHISNKTYLNVKKEYENIPKLNIELEKSHMPFLLDHGDLVFVDASEDYEGVSKYFVIENKSNEPILAGSHNIVAKEKENLISNKFKRFVFLNYEVKKQFKYFATGQKVKGINRRNIAQIKIPIPPIGEQNKIAEILSTWDNAIELKENILENSKTFKTNITKTIIEEEKDNVKKKNKKILKIKNYLTSKTKRVGSLDIEPVAVGVYGIRKRSEIFSKELSKDYSNNKIIEKNDLCFGIGTNNIVYDVLFEDEIYCVSPAYRVYKIKNVSPYYLKSYLDSHNAYLSNKYMIISARQGKSVEMKGLLNEKIYLPSIERQSKIVNYLKSIDDYIEKLEKEIDLLKLQKKGLMQQLLTGKIRVQV